MQHLTQGVVLCKRKKGAVSLGADLGAWQASSSRRAGKLLAQRTQYLPDVAAPLVGRSRNCKVLVRTQAA